MVKCLEDTEWRFGSGRLSGRLERAKRSGEAGGGYLPHFVDPRACTYGRNLTIMVRGDVAAVQAGRRLFLLVPSVKPNIPDLALGEHEMQTAGLIPQPKGAALPLAVRLPPQRILKPF